MSTKQLRKERDALIDHLEKRNKCARRKAMKRVPLPEAAVEAMTEKAVLVRLTPDSEPVWFPRSQCWKRQGTTLVVAAWLLEKRGLLK